jgi:hypothetical protein
MKKNKNTLKKNALSFAPYFCTACSHVVAEIDQAFVLDEKSTKYFCSEECIVNFHNPYIEFFNNQESQWRKEFKCEKEKLLLGSKEQKHWLDLALTEPTEVWLFQDAVGNEYFSLIKRCGESIDSPHLVVICHLFHLKPSFIFHHTFTQNFKLLERYRWGKSYTGKHIQEQHDENLLTRSEAEELILSKDLLQEIELLRSQLLSELILMRSEADIPLEGFSAYEKYIEKTIDQPDETFEYKTKDGQMLLVNISDQQEKAKTIYYFVLSMKLSPEMVLRHTDGRSSTNAQEQNRPMIIPVLAFPSLDSQIYQFYKRGQCINKRSLN